MWRPREPLAQGLLVARLELQVLSPGPCKFTLGYKIQLNTL